MFISQILSRVGASLARPPREAAVLSPEQFERSAMGERMRVDRNGSVLAIVLFRFPSQPTAKNFEYLGKMAEERLRLTDTVGQLRDGRLGLLLPDTPAEGAWKVVEDLVPLFAEGVAEKPEAEVLIYPQSPEFPAWEEESSGRHQPVGTGAGTGPEFGNPGEGYTSAEAFLVRPMPWWKRTLDIVGAGAGLMVAAPVVAVAGAAVALTSRGGVFFFQPREGLGGRRFRMIKIRTMYTDAEAKKAGLRRHSEQDGPAFKMTHDPRVTPVGRILRALSLDELPQLLNVLLGEMSLVGPRPLPVDESQNCLPWQRQRLQVTPGITCIWQVRGRNQVSFDEWVRMDLQYARKRTPWGDLRLVLETGPSVLVSKGPR